MRRITTVYSIASFFTLLAAALLFAAPAHAAKAVLDGGTVTLAEGESASFPISGGDSGPADLSARCEIGDVNGTASLTFDGEHYVPLSAPAVGDVLTLSGGDTRSYDLVGVVDASGGGDAYIAFHFTGAPAPMCFPGMACDGAEGKSGSVTVTCRNAGG
ncbi:hypothetical protein [Parvibaculum sp.]|uniref:hypothetical protein n=1 Tax=Parvibaculum sp. TaxID=2024848 RepID=UPI0032EDA151